MNWLLTALILLATLLVVFLETTFDGARHWLGAQVDLLPSLVVFASLSCGLISVAIVAFVGGLCFDSLSANPLGISVVPLFIIGFIIERYRGLILRDQFYAQALLGLSASAAAPVMTLLLLINSERTPLLGWFSLWQWLVMSVAGALAVPLWFRLFERAMRALSYRQMAETTFRSDREIKRGRM